jgi:hypothetical protein
LLPFPSRERIEVQVAPTAEPEIAEPPLPVPAPAIPIDSPAAPVCTAPFGVLVVDPSGDVRPCEYAITPLASGGSAPLDLVWVSEPVVRLRKSLSEGRLLRDPCGSCADLSAAASLDLSIATPTSLSLEASVVATRAGNLHGVGGWFSARLSKSVTMSNSPLATYSITRRNVFFPIDRPVGLEKGDRVQIKMQILPSELVVTWKVEVWGDADTRKARFTHSTFQGMLLCKEDLQRTQPHCIPKLSPWGEARRSILNLCDGRKTLAEIEQEIYRDYRELFLSVDRAAAYVAEVITQYSL